MIISMQGNWLVTVKSKSAAYDQRFIVSGANSGNGVHAGTPGTSAQVEGNQWSISIQNNPGSGYQSSDTRIGHPHQVGDNYEFEIHSNDAGGDQDFNDLVLVCSTPVNINDFIIFGKVSLYSGHCLFNPCRSNIFVIETPDALRGALKNTRLREILERDYPERIRNEVNIPNPPDPEPFKPVVIDLFNAASQPKIRQFYQRNIEPEKKSKAKKDTLITGFVAKDFTPLKVSRAKIPQQIYSERINNIEIGKIIDGLRLRNCNVDTASNITLTFEEYDRTAAELAGSAYSGTGNRRLLGDTITDMNGHYIFRFSFDMTFPGLEDAGDIAPGENINVVPYPDVIVKVTSYSPYTVVYESAPHYNIPNLKRINLCLPRSQVQPSSTCFNGSLIGSLGDVFLGGNQNASASFLNPALQRYGLGNNLEANGKISVGSSLAVFNVECAAWHGVIDIKGCMYDQAKTATQNKIKWYTIRIKRAENSEWQFVSQNHKHPKYSKRNLANYIGDDVGPFSQSLRVDGGPHIEVPAYINIQREIVVDGIDWIPDYSERYMLLNTNLYDRVLGTVTPGTFHLRIDGYDNNGHPVPDATDMIALYIDNLPLQFELTSPNFIDSSVVNSGCGLYRLSEAQMYSPVQFAFKANDPEGFVHTYSLTINRCPSPMIALQVNQPNPPLSDTLPGQTSLAAGNASSNTPHTCPGYTGTLLDFSNAGMINVEIQPAVLEDGWIRSGEYFTSLVFHLVAYKRTTNGKNSGISIAYHKHGQILMERINP